MRRFGWKGQKAVKPAQPEAGRAVPEGHSSAEFSHQNEPMTKAVPAEGKSAFEPMDPCLEELGHGQEDLYTLAAESAEIEAALDTMRQFLQDAGIDVSSIDETGTLALHELGESIGWTIRLTRGRVVDVTEGHVILSDDALGTVMFEDGETVSVEGVRRIGW